MPLYDVTNPVPRLLRPDAVDDNPYRKALERRLHPATMRRIERTVRDAVEATVQAGIGKLVFTKAGIEFGHKSKHPHKDIEHLWDAVVTAVGPGKECLIAVGCLLKAAIADRPENWLVYRRDSGEVDPITEKPIFISEYWISDSFQPPKAKTSAKDLVARFARRA